MSDVIAYVALIGSLASVISVILLVGVWKGAVDEFIRGVKCDREKYPPAEIYRMLTTLWQTYVIEPLHKRPDIAEFHSPCALTEKGLNYISSRTKQDLDNIIINPDKLEDIATGYLVVSRLGHERLSKEAALINLTLQEYIAILSTYISSCRDKEQED